jgi:hypothetical protein
LLLVILDEADDLGNADGTSVRATLRGVDPARQALR